MEKVKDKELLKRLENITYFDLDEFLALDIYDLEKALTSGDTTLEDKAKEILGRFNDDLKKDKEVLNFILKHAKSEAQTVYEYLKEVS